MKKLILLSLSLSLLACNNIMPEPQSESDFINSQCVAVNIEKLTIANTIISPDHKNNFYQDLLKLNEITQEKLLFLINQYSHNSDTFITKVSSVYVPELLKEQKNIIIKDIYAFIMQKSYFGETRADDYINYSLMGGMLLCTLHPINKHSAAAPPFAINLQPIIAGIGSIIVIVNLYRSYKHFQYIKNKKMEITVIDCMINTIEEIEHLQAP